MRMRRVGTLVKLAALCLAIGAVAPAAEPGRGPAPQRIDAESDKALKAMSASLAGAKEFTFESYTVREEMLESGQKVEFATNQKIAVRRPDGAVATITGDREDYAFVYDGKTITLHNKLTKSYAQLAAPAKLDDTLDMLATKYSMVLPLADMVFSDPYASMTGGIHSSQDLGIGYVFETRCRHLAFRQEGIDWQIWLDEGNQMLPRKIVITYKESPGHLQYTAYFTKWDLAAQVPAASLTFVPPADAKKVEFAVPASRPAGDGK